MRAMREGEWVLLDEMNLSTPEMLNSLALLLDSLTHRRRICNAQQESASTGASVAPVGSGEQSDASLLTLSELLPGSACASSAALRVHPEFRLFACMNPATDFGKHELPGGIRARFAEIYIADSLALEDLVDIVRYYLQRTLYLSFRVK